MPRLSLDARLRAIGMLEGGATQAAVAVRFGVHRNTVRTLWTRYRDTGVARDRPRSGRPRVTSQRQDGYIRVMHLRNRFQTGEATARTIPGLRRISGRTVRNRLRDYGIRPRRPCVRPLLQPRHRQARLQWSRNHLRWRLAQWQGILFTDESRFHLDGSDGRQRVYRRVGERYRDQCISQRRYYGGGSVMVWGGITAHGRTPLVLVEGNLNAQRYRDEVLRPHVVPFIRGQARHMTLQQDNARPHVARVAMDFLRQENVQVMEWPAMSPDLAPIEHVWDEMGRRLRQRQNQPVTLRELGEALREVWQNIPQAVLANLVASMRRRCVACINARGGHTHY